MAIYKGVLSNTPIGSIGVYADDNYITKLDLINSGAPTADSCDELKKALEQLDEYFKGVRKTFDLKLRLGGTAFRNTVWQELLNIPYGETITYKELASRAGSAKAYRAVGQANHENPIPIIIPCHRVIGANANLIGYAGGLALKKTLLDLEARYR